MPEGRPCSEEQNALAYLKMIFSTVALLWPQDFSPVYTVGTWFILEINLTKVWGPFSDWVFLELSSQTCPHSVTTIHQLHFRFFYIGTGSHGGFSHGFLLQKVVTLWIHLSIQFGESALCSELFSLRNLKTLVDLSVYSALIYC